jgi:asparagine synthase (glutamine-hydrolysing)
MCGLTGFWHPGVAAELSAIEAMAIAIRHRGPDAGGTWLDSVAGLALGHRRLSIIDLSAAGTQPMRSHCGRYVISFNGEVYNFEAVRAELRAHGLAPAHWRGHSDTEVVLEAIAAWGLEVALGKFVGMFALAVWDRERRSLHLARDRMGEKPLYYGWAKGAFVFGSELRSLAAFPGFAREIDRGALALLLRHSCVPAPYCIYRDCKKLLPGTWLSLGEADVARRIAPDPVAYWSQRAVAERGQQIGFAGSAQDAVTALERTLTEAIAGQMVADVPLGAFLSGGIDSSTIVALMQRRSARPIKTFTIGFHEKGFNEAEHAKAIASHLGTQHTEHYVSPGEALAVVASLPTIYDEPFSDSSQIPTYLVSRLAREHVTVALSGDAGDELFGGYNHYSLAARIWRTVGWAPHVARVALARMLGAIPAEGWNFCLNPVGFGVPRDARGATIGDRAHKLAEILPNNSPNEIFRSLTSHWKQPSKVVLNSAEPVTRLTDFTQRPKLPDFEHRMMYFDSISYLPDDILVKVDRAAMAVGLETRVPLLDHRVVELSWRLPLGFKIRAGERKWLLRQVLYRHVPREMVDRPKMGFGVPVSKWLRGSLREWAESLLDGRRLRQEGYFDPAALRRCWSEHLSEKRDWGYHLWDVLMFQAWLETTR